MLQDEGFEAPLGDRPNYQVCGGDDRGATAFVIEQGHLTEVISGTEHTPAAVGRGDFRLSVKNDHEADALRTAYRDMGATGMPHFPHLLGDFLQVAVRHPGEKLHGAQIHRFGFYIVLAMAGSKTAALGKVPLFAHSTSRELEFVASRTDEVVVPAGRQLVRQGQLGDTFYVLLEGEADVEVDGEPRPVLGPGAFFGEISMLDRGPATATVVTRTPARLMVMSHAQFRDAIKGNDDLLGQVMAAMGERLRADSLARQAPQT